MSEVPLLNTPSQNYLDIVYHDTSARATNNLLGSRNISQTNGEILYPSVQKLLAALALTEKDVFVDLGSGAGKVVAQVFLESPVREAYGIELVPELHQTACAAAQRIQQELPQFYSGGRALNFYQGNFLEFPLKGASVVLINSVCFNQELMLALGEKLEANFDIHTVLSLRPIPGLERLRFRKTLRIECSWDTALCYLYR